MTSEDTRYLQLMHWLEADVGCRIETIEPASTDASFRRYFRIRNGSMTQILMDAPPPQENVKPFMAVLSLLKAAGVNTPELLAADPEQGFLLLSDLGNRPYLSQLSADTVDSLYEDALKSLMVIQSSAPLRKAPLPAYDADMLIREVNLFTEWYLERLLGIRIDPDTSLLLENSRSLLVASALEQPQVFVHRDFHSRNLMVTSAQNPGILDFQDAVIGPMTYDLVSLLRDCYIEWPDATIDAFRNRHCQRLFERGLLDAQGADTFERWFDLMGLQRHLKAIGIFARLKLRDGKGGYLADIPRTFGYVLKVCAKYPALQPLGEFLKAKADPQTLKDPVP